MGEAAMTWRDAADWGSQGGLLSARECETLYGLVCLAGPRMALEVGHYCGLSTYVIANALKTLRDTVGDIGSLVTVDSYEPDEWIQESGKERFERNRLELFPEVRAIEARSQDIDPSVYDFVFYDADHGQEQLAFTRKVHEAPAPRVFVFDDADFPVPARCCQFLREHDWFQIPIPIHRGPYDKTDKDTMTLAAFVRMR